MESLDGLESILLLSLALEVVVRRIESLIGEPCRFLFDVLTPCLIITFPLWIAIFDKPLLIDESGVIILSDTVLSFRLMNIDCTVEGQ